MNQVFAELIRNRNGQAVLGSPDKGCKFCGTVEMQIANNGKAVYYHPGVECCIPALETQIVFRKEEIEALQRKIENHNAEILRLEETVQTYGSGNSREASEARMKLDKARRGLQRQIKVLQGYFFVLEKGGSEREISGQEISESNVVGIKQLNQEIDRLHKKLGWMRGRAA